MCDVMFDDDDDDGPRGTRPGGHPGVQDEDEEVGVPFERLFGGGSGGGGGSSGRSRERVSSAGGSQLDACQSVISGSRGSGSGGGEDGEGDDGESRRRRREENDVAAAATDAVIDALAGCLNNVARCHLRLHSKAWTLANLHKY